MSNPYGSRRPGSARAWVTAIAAALLVVGGGAVAAVALLPQSHSPTLVGSARPTPSHSTHPAASPTATASMPGGGSPSASPSPKQSPHRPRTATTVPAHWTYPVVIDQQVYNNNEAQINAVSCVTAVACYAVDNQGDILATTSEKSWSVVNSSGSGSNLTAISCATASFCVAIDSSDAIVLSDGSWNDPVTVDSTTSSTMLMPDHDILRCR